jgi:hypothetical protein
LIAFISAPLGAACSGYSYERTFTINHSLVPSTQTDFPVLISTADVTLGTGGSGHLVNASGFDMILSTMSDCSYALNWDTETYNLSLGSWTLWVKVPSVSSAQDTSVYLCYGKSGITSYPSVSTNVWTNGYKGVWHLADGTTLSNKESTSNNFTLNPTGPPTPISGQIDGAAKFVPNQYMTNLSLSIPAASSITISYWEYEGGYYNSSAFSIGQAVDPNRLQAHSPWSDGNIYWDYGDSGAGGRVSVSYSSQISKWSYVSLEFDAATTAHTIYLDGSSAVSSNSSSAPSSTETGIDIGVYGSNFLNASLDEFRVSTVARSSDWVTAEYNNQKSGSTFLTMGAETSCGAAAPTGNAFWFGEF